MTLSGHCCLSPREYCTHTRARTQTLQPGGQRSGRPHRHCFLCVCVEALTSRRSQLPGSRCRVNGRHQRPNGSFRRPTEDPRTALLTLGAVKGEELRLPQQLWQEFRWTPEDVPTTVVCFGGRTKSVHVGLGQQNCNYPVTVITPLL